MVVQDIIVGILISAYLFLLWLHLYSYRISKNRRMAVSAIILILIILKNLYVFFYSMWGEVVDPRHFYADISALLAIIAIWVWRK